MIGPDHGDGPGVIESIRKALRVSVLAGGLARVAAMADMPVAHKDGTARLFRFNAPDFWTVRAGGGARDLTAPGDTGGLGVNRAMLWSDYHYGRSSPRPTPPIVR